MSKIILTSDLHFKDGLYLQVGLDYLDFLFDYCYNNNINKVAILGDLLEKANKIKNDVFVPLFKKIENAKDSGIEFWFILGNHDITSTVTNSSLLETFERFGHLIKSSETFEFKDVAINMAPYTKDNALVPTVGADYLFTHLAISEFDLGKGRIATEAETQSFPISYFSNYKKVFTGHFHKRQQKENIEYIGSPYQLDFGDIGDYNKGFVVFDIESGEEKFIKYTMAPKFLKYYYDEIWDKINNNKLRECELNNSIVKIIVNKKVDGLAKLKTVLYNNFGVIDIINEFDTPKENFGTSAIKVEANVSVVKMLEEYISQVSIKNIDNKDLLEKFRDIYAEVCK